MYPEQDNPTQFGTRIVFNPQYLARNLKKFEKELLEAAQAEKVRIEYPVGQDQSGVPTTQEVEVFLVPAEPFADWLVKKINHGKATDGFLLFILSFAEIFSAEGVVHAMTERMAARMDEDLINGVFTSLGHHLYQYAQVPATMTIPANLPEQEKWQLAQAVVEQMTQILQMLEDQFLAINAFVVRLAEHFESQKYQVPLEARPELLHQLQSLEQVIREVQKILDEKTDRINRAVRFE